MASRRGLTGGTGDVNPQFLSFRIVAPSADARGVVAVAIPIQRMSQGSGRAQIMEVLKVKYDGSTLGGSGAGELTYRY